MKAIVTAICAAFVCHAQQATATLLGTVVDPSGATAPGVAARPEPRHQHGT